MLPDDAEGSMPCLDRQIRAQLYRYMATVLKTIDCPAIEIGGMDDHIHVLCTLSKNLAVAKLVEEINKRTSKWLKSKGTAFGRFHWQNGYGAFSVSQSSIETVKGYIANQERHHRRMTFQDEFRRLLERYQVGYDERHVWD